MSRWGLSWDEKWSGWEFEPTLVVLLPVDARRLRTKLDRALYTLAIVARDNAPLVRTPSFHSAPPRVRLTGLESTI